MASTSDYSKSHNDLMKYFAKVIMIMILFCTVLAYIVIVYKKKEEWSGHRPSTVDSLPIIGPSKNDNKVFFGYGHHHIGLTAGPKTGEMIGKNILRDNNQYDLTPYSPDR